MRSLLGFLVLVTISATWASAAPIPVHLAVTDGTNVVSLNPDGDLLPIGQYHSEGSQSTATFSLEWDIFAGPTSDIQIANYLSVDLKVTNLMSTAQTYSALATLPVPFLATSGIQGIWGGAILDLNGDGATLSTDDTTGDPMFLGLVDGVPKFVDYPHPFTLVAAPGKGNGTLFAGFGPAAILGPPIVGEIGVQLRFTASAGDKAFSHGTFHAFSVPEPPGFMLGGIAALVTVGFISRRKPGTAA
ncbi:MAG: hypothetical protein K1X71_06610 [Pirellulales bacterium]|nr:hypothetical protein [Pirellulales bacterium]